MYFLAPTEEGGPTALWRTDGSPHGTVLVERIPSPNPDTTDLWTWSGIRAGNLVYFMIQPLSATGPWAGGIQLWRTDGTAEGTFSLTEPLRTGDEGPIPELFEVDRTVLFAASDNVPAGDPRQHGRELWTSRGTVSSTRLLQELRPGPEWSDPASFVRAGRYVYFLAGDDSNIHRLWALPVELVRCPRPLR